MPTKDDIISAILKRSDTLAAEGVAHLALFGSRARGDAKPDSDLDILIDTAPGRRFSLLDLAGVALAIEDATGIPCQVVMRRSLTPEIASRIRDDIVEVF